MILDVVIPAHNGAATLHDTLTALLSQQGRGTVWRSIIVVDDASKDDTSQIVVTHVNDGVELVRHSRRNGRANACNHGAAASRADALLFLDADCRPLQSDLLQRHAAALVAGADVSFGTIRGGGHGIWKSLADVIERERGEKARRGEFLALTSCNMAIRRKAFESAGGFHTGYSHYGFEDRDLLAVLAQQGCRCRFDAQAIVAHRVDTDLAVLVEKMWTAGRFTAPLFRQRHPAAYRQTKFSAVDVNTAGRLVRLIACVSPHLYQPLRAVANRFIENSTLPVRLRIGMIRAMMALAYMHGTSQSGESGSCLHHL